jgi:hypothetical protein
MHIFKNKKMSILHHCTSSYIEETTDNKDLILNVTSQNNAIKVGT